MDRLRAPAKMTLNLRVTGVRPDGYHLIDAVMVSVDLCDHLELAIGDGLVIDGPYGPKPGDTVAHEDNLVTRALRLVGRTARVRLTKNIPAGAGLGGGSSDAAAILRWAACDDPEAAARLGADVPFCVRGGRARVRGIGEIVEPEPFVAETYTLLTPRIHSSTPAVYRHWDEMGGPTGPYGNDLEPAAVECSPGLVEARDRLWELTGTRPRLAGSGSTWFVAGAFPAADTVVVRTLPAATGKTAG